MTTCSNYSGIKMRRPWAWMGAAGAQSLNAIYGTLGTPSVENIPGMRQGGATWTDKAANFWLFGGFGVDAYGNTGYLNDLWKFNPSTNEWAWMGGNAAMSCVSTPLGQARCEQLGVYGTLGTAAAGNIPGGRYEAASWVDNSGNFWIFGGDGFDANGFDFNVDSGVLNDLWEFNPSTGLWTWMGGGSVVGGNCWIYYQYPPGLGNSANCALPGVYGTLGTPATGNNPGSRMGATTWTDSKGNAWLFGGWGYNVPQQIQYFFNDLWEFSPSTNEWTWMGGSNTTAGDYCFFDGDLMSWADCGQAGVYGTQGTPSPQNIPGSRSNATGWTDAEGNLWLFEGWGFDVNGSFGNKGFPYDLWKFSPSTKEWTWMGGSSIISQGCTFLNDSCTFSLVNGTLGTPAVGNFPAPRIDAAAWNDNSGNVWLFGGSGFNDLWEFYPSTNEWSWMGGISEFGCVTLCGVGGVYGERGVPAPGNIPAGRQAAARWTDNHGNFWVFGGFAISGGFIDLWNNDIWEYRPTSGPLPTTGVPTFSVPGGTYSTAQTVMLSDTTNGVTIYYTTDGSTPTTSSYGYSPSLSKGLSIPFSETIKAFAVASGCQPSAIVTETYTLSTKVAPPTFNPPGATYSSAQIVFITDATPGVNFLYTTDGSTPTASSPEIPGGPLTVSTSETVNAIAVAGGYTINSAGASAVATATYTLSLPQAATPTFNVPSGTYTTTQTVTISDATPGVNIFYTTDGTSPTANSIPYRAPITVSSTETLQAVATGTGYNNSAVFSATYTVNLPPPSFTVAASPTSLTVTAGQSATTTVTVTPANGFNSAVTFICSGLPAGATCTFSPASVEFGGMTPGSTTLTVTTSPTTSSFGRSGIPLFPPVSVAIAVCVIGFRKRRRMNVLMFAVSFAFLGLVCGCGGGGSGGSTPPPTPQPFTSTVTLTATGGSLQSTTTFSLTVN